MASSGRVDLRGVGLGAMIVALSATAIHAQSATWLENPVNREFTDDANWSGGQAPTGKARFGESTIRDLTIGAPWAVNSMQFNAGAPAYTFRVDGMPFALLGAGIINNSSNAPRFILTNVGSLEVANSASAGNAIIKVTNFAALGLFDDATAGSATVRVGDFGTALFFGDSTGGTARFVVNGSGFVDFSGSAGQNGVVTAGSIEGNGTILIGDNFVVGGNNRSTTFSGEIGPCGCLGGVLTKVGTGTLTLSGTSTYTGGTFVNGGVLNVTGSLASSSGVVINDGGALSGDGRVSDVVVRAGGLLAPGTANLGRLRVQGDLTFRNGSGYLVNLTPDAAARTRVSGAANLNGTVFAAFAPGSYVSRQYTILTAATVNGQFDDFEAPGFLATLTYTNTAVALELEAALGAQRGLGGNQRGTSAAINDFFNNGGALPPAFVQLFSLSGRPLASALSQITGEPAAGASTAGLRAGNIFLTQMLNPFGAGPSGNVAGPGAARSFAAEHNNSDALLAYASLAPVERVPAGPWSAWGVSYGGQGYIDGNPGAGTQDVSLNGYGVAAGADYRVGAGTTLGFALSGGHAGWDVSRGLGGGSSDVFQLGLYGVQRWGPAYLGAAITAGWHDMDTKRTVTLPGGGPLSADFDAQSYGARLEGGYRFDVAGLGVMPYAALQALAIELPAYSERPSANPFALSYSSRSESTLRTELGAWFETVLAPLQTGVLIARARLAWAHDEGSDQGVTAAFQSLPGTSFVVTGAAAPKNLALLSAATELRLANGLSLGARIDGEVASTAAAYAARADLKWRW